MSLRDLRNQYFALVPPRLIHQRYQVSPYNLASVDGQHYLLTALLEEPRFPQPEDGYRRTFWRGMMRDLEEGLRDINDQEDMILGEDEVSLT